MNPCVFCQIVSRTSPGYIVFEDAHFLAILDIEPVSIGHTLIIPKKHYRWVYEVDHFSRYWEIAGFIARALVKASENKSVSITTSGRHIPHAHIHVFLHPKTKKGEYLPGIESAKRISMSSSQLREVAAKLRGSVK